MKNFIFCAVKDLEVFEIKMAIYEKISRDLKSTKPLIYIEVINLKDSDLLLTQTIFKTTMKLFYCLVYNH